MKLNVLLIGGFVLLILLMGGFGFYIASQLSIISEISHEVEEATDISQAALDFNVENFHTQLEVWEYAYEPNPTRLKAFKKHDTTLIELLDELSEEVEEEEEDRLEDQEISALYEGALDDIRKIESDLKLVRNDWVGLFESIGKLEEAKARGLDEGDEEYEVLEAASAERVKANEALFDRLQFNNQVNNFVNRQEELVHKLESKQESLISGFVNTIYILISVVLVLGLVIAYFISKSISKPLDKLSQSIDEISKGNFNVQIEKTGNIEEINTLVESLSRIMKTMKLAVLEKGSVKIEKKDETKKGK